MKYETVTLWDVVKRFLVGWIIVGLILVFVSCIRYKEFILTVFTNNAWAFVNAVMPVVIIVAVIVYMIKIVLH